VKKRSRKLSNTHIVKKKSEFELSLPYKIYSGYLGKWKRGSDEIEEYMADIHEISVTGESIITPMRTKKDVIS